MITVFTPTYNRAHTLRRLYQSLIKQDCFDFEWLVINDGSTDNTDELFQQWLIETNSFPIRYYRVKNGGKQRAINQALQWAKGEFFFIVDSDDFLMPDAISFVQGAFHTLPQNTSFIGISGIRVGLDGLPLHRIPLIDAETGYQDANNLERTKWNLQADMAEVFYTEKLKAYSFPVWRGEKFTPEAVVWDKIAMDGYKLRWYNKITYLCDYQPDGLTHSSWKLLKHNPMGYAMLFNTQLVYEKEWEKVLSLILQYLSCCFLAHEPKQIIKCVYPTIACLLLPCGWLLSIRRKQQFKKYV